MSLEHRTPADTAARGWTSGSAKAPRPTSAGVRMTPRPLPPTVAGLLVSLLGPDEVVLDWVRGIEDAALLDRACLGWLFPFLRRVVIVVTGERLLEIAVDWRGSKSLGRVRSCPWASQSSVKMRRDKLELSGRNGPRWWVHDAADRERVRQALVQVRGLCGPPRSEKRPPQPICDRCGGRTDLAGCLTCGTPRRMARLAGWLSLAIPGAGARFAGHPVLAVLFGSGELLAIASIAVYVLAADGGLKKLIAFAVLLPVLVLVKLEGVVLARVLAERAGAIDRPSLRRWRRLLAPGFVVSTVALVAPIPFAGSIGRDITADLEVQSSPADPDWVCTSDRSLWHVDPEIDSRSECARPDGLVVQIRAQPLRRFETFDELPARIAQEFGEHLLEGPAMRRLGPHDVLVTRVTAPGTQERLGLFFFVLHRSGRDVHIVSSEVEAADGDDTERALARLIRRAIWVRPRGSEATPEPADGS